MKKDLLRKGYEPREVEQRWYSYWEKEKLFAANEDGDRKGYSIVIPPPNVTGVLHMGHALNNTLQDILCRYRRHRGDNVLWMPGTDHAGIATQNVVEKKLAEEGTDRHQLGRDKFIETVWQWREKYGGAIINQLKRLGASCDWDRERFTMDEGLSNAVRKVFVQLYEEGLIYRGNYIINWCPRCETALADLEVEHEEIDGNLYHIRYPFEGDSDGLVVVTTRPETMLGDTAVAVHPDDERYTGLSASHLILPLMERRIPIITDKYVDLSFGSGALKVTPAHDPNDYEISLRQNLPLVKVIDDTGRMTAEAGRFEGMDRFECRKAVVKALQAEGLLEKIEPHRHSVGHCYRCKKVIEPNLSRQWFVKAKPLAEKAVAAVETGQTTIVPEVWTSTYYDWMNNIRDWCVSRQIWWGHRIPAWTCEDCGELIVAMEAPSECPACKGSRLTRETDVLDTWFSSALWPFSTMGWPENTKELQTFYPTSILVTSFDILFFWVARMMMMGIHFMDEVPFHDVYLHALVRDKHDKKMSKSTGNVIDPLEVMGTYGTDAVRFTLTAFAAQGREIRLDEDRIEGYRFFINKIWNAARFAQMHVGDTTDEVRKAVDNPAELPLVHQWILSRTARTIDEVRTGLDEYHFNTVASANYQFIWHEFCDWYLEWIKADLYSDDEIIKQQARGVLLVVLETILKLIHPIIPFVTEEIWSVLPGERKVLMLEPYPESQDDWLNETAEKQMELLMGVITGIRNIRAEADVHPSQMIDAFVTNVNGDTAALIDSFSPAIKDLTRLNGFTVADGSDKPDDAATYIFNDIEIFVPLKGLVDVDSELAKLGRDRDKVESSLKQVNGKLSNEKFLANAPAAVVAKEKGKKEELEARLVRIEEAEQRLHKIGG